SISYLSGGEAQRVAIARALLSNARMLIMDEPLSALDQSLKKEIMPLLRTIVKEFQTPILYVSHSFNEVSQLTDHLVLIDKGKILAEGDPQTLTTNPSLAKHLEDFDAGTILNAIIYRQDEKYGLSQLEFSGGFLHVPYTEGKIGDSVRVRIKARDITLALKDPDQISMLNRLMGKVESITEVDLRHAYVKIKVGNVSLMARITRKSIDTLGIKKHMPIFCLIKAVTLES
ncbi:MAG: ATP-binding cassette domain-containing protein, partial [Alphaproteobacteria bacterium]|nr:ATP-binding cassette domain-containing protein [Alphaproteobacteria bacterium]